MTDEKNAETEPKSIATLAWERERDDRAAARQREGDRLALYRRDVESVTAHRTSTDAYFARQLALGERQVLALEAIAVAITVASRRE